MLAKSVQSITARFQESQVLCQGFTLIILGDMLRITKGKQDGWPVMIIRNLADIKTPPEIGNRFATLSRAHHDIHDILMRLQHLAGFALQSALIELREFFQTITGYGKACTQETRKFLLRDEHLVYATDLDLQGSAANSSHNMLKGGHEYRHSFRSCPGPWDVFA